MSDGKSEVELHEHWTKLEKGAKETGRPMTEERLEQLEDIATGEMRFERVLDESEYRFWMEELCAEVRRLRGLIQAEQMPEGYDMADDATTALAVELAFVKAELRRLKDEGGRR